MLSLSCTASKLVAVVTALSILSPPPYGKPHLLQGLKLEMGVFAHCELQIEVHEKRVDVFQFEVVLFEVQKHVVMNKDVMYLYTSIEVIPSSSLKRRSFLTDDFDITTALSSTIACICFNELTVLEVAVFQNYSMQEA
ncbi:hypothetical protein Tco_0758754 [Tanacetum coccineum]